MILTRKVIFTLLKSYFDCRIVMILMWTRNYTFAEFMRSFLESQVLDFSSGKIQHSKKGSNEQQITSLYTVLEFISSHSE